MDRAELAQIIVEAYPKSNLLIDRAEMKTEERDMADKSRTRGREKSSAKTFAENHTDRAGKNPVRNKQAFRKEKTEHLSRKEETEHAVRREKTKADRNQDKKSDADGKNIAPHRKVSFDKPGNFLYPLPAVMVSCADKDGKPNIITVAWAGTVCTNPPMLSISIRKERYSYQLIKDTGEFVVNLTNKSLARATDYCGCRSGRDHDKFAECHLTPGKGQHVNAPTIEESPVSIECKVRQVLELGSHDMFVADVLGIQVDSRYMDEKQTLHLEKANLITYSHGKYFTLGDILGTFGYSVRKQEKRKK